MLHLLISAGAAVVIAGVLFLLATRFLPAGEQIAPAVRDEPPWELPDERRLTAEDVDDLRLPVALRGYRFAETDLLLDRLAEELRSRDEEIARLRRHLPADGSAERPVVADGAGAESAESTPAAGDDDGR